MFLRKIMKRDQKMKAERPEGKEHTCAPQRLRGAGCVSWFRTVRLTGNIEESTLVQPPTAPSLNPAERKANALSFPPGCKTGWKASNMMKYGVEEWSGQKQLRVLKLQDERGPRAVCHTPFLPGPVSDWVGGSLGTR